MTIPTSCWTCCSRTAWRTCCATRSTSRCASCRNRRRTWWRANWDRSATWPAPRAPMPRPGAARDARGPGAPPVISAAVIGRPWLSAYYGGQPRQHGAGAHGLGNYAFLRDAMRRPGVGIVPDYVVHEDVARGDLVQALPDWRLSIFGRTMYMLHMPNRHHPRAIAMMIEYILRRAQVAHDGSPACWRFGLKTGRAGRRAGARPTSISISRLIALAGSAASAASRPCSAGRDTPAPASYINDHAFSRVTLPRPKSEASHGMPAATALVSPDFLHPSFLSDLSLLSGPPRRTSPGLRGAPHHVQVPFRHCLARALHPDLDARAGADAADQRGQERSWPTAVRGTSNGVPVVIAALGGGVSNNKFTQFNVGPSGVVLNNSGGASQTQLAGQVAATRCWATSAPPPS